MGIVGVLKGLYLSTRLTKSFLTSFLFFLINLDVFYFVSIFVFFLFSYIFNDVVDYEADKLQHKKRALPMGLLSLKQAGVFSGFFLFFGLVFVFLFLREFFVLFLIVYLASMYYSVFLKKTFPSFAIKTWVFLLTVLILYPLDVTFYHYGFVFSFIYFRELFLDYRDHKNDDLFCKTRSLSSLIKDRLFFYLLFFGLVSVVCAILIPNLVFVVVSVFALFIFLTYYFKFGLNEDSINDLQFILMCLFVFIVFI